jgi:hypothetical protein
MKCGTLPPAPAAEPRLKAAHCRTRVQGVWTHAEDVELRRMMEGGQKTKDVAEALGRLPQTCRNRWRVICTGAAKKGVSSVQALPSDAEPWERA